MRTSEYTYQLPPDRIAHYPLAERDTSKLLFYKERKISHHTFKEVSALLPDNALLVFNNTRVIPARLHFRKESGARIEIFLLTPVAPSSLLIETMSATGTCEWNCTIGNLRRWNDGSTLVQTGGGVTLRARLTDRQSGTVRFDWDGAGTFAEAITALGTTPLPPYIRREAEPTDRERYQTIYSQNDGAVAAPTAGLHFTPAVFDDLKSKGIEHDFLTLHVSAGTFQPIKTDNPEDHLMHEEQVIVSRENLENLLRGDRNIIAVGTTSMRSLESLYWYGVRLTTDPDADFSIDQTEPYRTKTAPSATEAFAAVARYMDRLGKTVLTGETSIYIRPGYTFRVCDGLITNFHQPGSTLILLVAAFVGEDWRKIYDEALAGGYRFLSYGDSSLLLPFGN